jgi:serine protease Do
VKARSLLLLLCLGQVFLIPSYGRGPSVLRAAEAPLQKPAQGIAQKTGFPIQNQTDRAQLYRELAKDVQSLNHQLGITRRVVKLVSPSVVHIEAIPLPQFHLHENLEEAGSGILVDIDGHSYVLTNCHVIRHSDKDHLHLDLADGSRIEVQQIWMDPETDVAILAVAGNNLASAQIGDSSKAEMGEIVLAFGSPFNLSRSVTRGIISAKGRCNLDLGKGEVRYQNFIQTDAAINPGNSGGPLVNLRGEVIGLNTAIASSSGGNDGIGFSIPINIVVHIMKQLLDTGSVERGFLGVTLDATFDARAARQAGLSRLMGTRITEVSSYSPAARADLQAEDVIVQYNGMVIDNNHHLISLVKLTESGREVEMVVLRNGKRLTKIAQIGTLEDYRAQLK